MYVFLPSSLHVAPYTTVVFDFGVWSNFSVSTTTSSCLHPSFAHVNNFTSACWQSDFPPFVTTYFPSEFFWGTPFSSHKIDPTITSLVESILCPNFLAMTFTWILWHVSHSKASIKSCSQSAAVWVLSIFVASNFPDLSVRI